MADPLGPHQEAFSSELASDTGLDLGVIRAWVHAEQGFDSPATGSLPYSDWLNIGWTDSGRANITYDPVWTQGDVAGAQATTRWLTGEWCGAHNDYCASSGVRGILSGAGSSPANQIRLIQSSGWASSGYPALLASYQAVTGTGQPSGQPSAPPATGITDACRVALQQAVSGTITMDQCTAICGSPCTSDPVGGLGGLPGVGGAVTSAAGVITSAADAFKFLFSLRGLEVIGGGLLVLLGLYLVGRQLGAPLPSVPVVG